MVAVAKRTSSPGCGGLSGGLPPDVVAVVRKRHCRAWRLYVAYPNGNQKVVMWHSNDKVLHVKKHIEEKTDVPVQEQILRKRGSAITLVDEHLLST